MKSMHFELISWVPVIDLDKRYGDPVSELKSRLRRSLDICLSFVEFVSSYVRSPELVMWCTYSGLSMPQVATAFRVQHIRCSTPSRLNLSTQLVPWTQLASSSNWLAHLHPSSSPDYNALEVWYRHVELGHIVRIDLPLVVVARGALRSDEVDLPISSGCESSGGTNWRLVVGEALGG